MVTRYTPVTVGVYSDTGVVTFPTAENLPWAFTVGAAKTSLEGLAKFGRFSTLNSSHRKTSFLISSAHGQTFKVLHTFEDSTGLRDDIQWSRFVWSRVPQLGIHGLTPSLTR